MPTAETSLLGYVGIVYGIGFLALGTVVEGRGTIPDLTVGHRTRDVVVLLSVCFTVVVVAVTFGNLLLFGSQQGIVAVVVFPTVLKVLLLAELATMTILFRGPLVTRSDSVRQLTSVHDRIHRQIADWGTTHETAIVTSRRVLAIALVVLVLVVGAFSLAGGFESQGTLFGTIPISAVGIALLVVLIALVSFLVVADVLPTGTAIGRRESRARRTAVFGGFLVLTLGTPGSLLTGAILGIKEVPALFVQPLPISPLDTLVLGGGLLAVGYGWQFLEQVRSLLGRVR